jgi:hypothetical protein
MPAMAFHTPGLRLAAAALLALAPAPAGAAAPQEQAPAPGATVTLVACAPGFPGSTAEAQPTMDAFAARIAAAAGLPDGAVAAVYHESEAAGRERLAAGGPLLAMVPLPFFVRYREELALAPLRSVEPESGGDEIWSLVARKGRIADPADLAGWEVTGQPGYAPRFVRGPVLGQWGELPAQTHITFTGRALSALRRAQRGEDVAVLLDRTQAGALPSLPFGDDLEIVARSRPLPATLLCGAGDRLDPDIAGRLLEALDHMHSSEPGRAALEGVRVRRFRPLDDKGLADVQAALDGD